MNQNRLLQDYFGRRPYPGTGVLEDYMQPAPQYAGPAMPVQRLGLSPQAEMGVSRYMNLDGGRGFSRANAERLYAQELDMQAQQEQEQALLNARAAEQAVTQVDPLSPQYSQQLTGILGRYGQAAVPALKGILPLQEVLRKAAQPDDARDPYLNKITDPRAFQSYRQRRSSGMAPEQAWEQTLVETEEDDLMTQALQAGVPLADVQGMRQNGRLDKYKVLEALSSAKRTAGPSKDISAEGYNRLLTDRDALSAAEAMQTPEGKVEAYKKEFKGKVPKTDEEWAIAYNLVQKDINKARSKFENALTSYGSQYRLPPELGGQPATRTAPPQPVPTDPFATPTGPVSLGPQGAIPPVAMPPSKSAATETAAGPTVGSPAKVPTLEEETDTLGTVQDGSAQENAKFEQSAARVNEILNKEREKAVDSLKGKFQSLGDERFIRRAARSILQDEAIPASILGLEDQKDFAGGTKFLPAVDLIAKKLGVDPDAHLKGKGEKGEFTVFSTDKQTAGQPITWRDAIRDYAKKLIGEKGAAPAPIKSSIPNVTIGQIRQVP